MQRKLSELCTNHGISINSLEKIPVLTVSRIETRLQGMCFCSRHLASTPAKDHTTDGKPTDMLSFSHEMGDGSLTGQVGTALYVAPELSTSGNKAIYNQVRKFP